MKQSPGTLNYATPTTPAGVGHIVKLSTPTILTCASVAIMLFVNTDVFTGRVILFVWIACGAVLPWRFALHGRHRAWAITLIVICSLLGIGWIVGMCLGGLLRKKIVLMGCAHRVVAPAGDCHPGLSAAPVRLPNFGSQIPASRMDQFAKFADKFALMPGYNRRTCTNASTTADLEFLVLSCRP